MLDYNEDRQVSFDIPTELEKMDIYAKFIGTKFEDKVSIHLNTIGEFCDCFFLQFFVLLLGVFSTPKSSRRRRIQPKFGDRNKGHRVLPWNGPNNYRLPE